MKQTNAPTEAQEQAALFRWAGFAAAMHPELRLLYHIPNEGKRSAATGARMREGGMRKGVPDICLPVPRGNYAALYIELKRRDGGRVSEDQRAWIDALNRAGNRAVICRGWDEARKAVEDYLREGRAHA